MASARPKGHSPLAPAAESSSAPPSLTSPHSDDALMRTPRACASVCVLPAGHRRCGDAHTGLASPSQPAIITVQSGILPAPAAKSSSAPPSLTSTHFDDALMRTPRAFLCCCLTDWESQASCGRHRIVDVPQAIYIRWQRRVGCASKHRQNASTLGLAERS